MKEHFFAYKIMPKATDLVCSQFDFEEEKMVVLLKEITSSHFAGIYWIFRQVAGMPKQALSIIDCSNQRIYFHHSGQVESLEETIRRLDS